MENEQLVVGVGEIKISNHTTSSIKTFALGSCIAIVIYDKNSKKAGMAHIALSDSSINPERSATLPGYFVNTAIPLLLKKMNINTIENLDNSKNIEIKMAGGASVLDDSNFFNIGENNVNTSKKILKNYNLKIKNEDIGGKISRNVTIDIKTGKVEISNSKIGTWTI